MNEKTAEPVFTYEELMVNIDLPTAVAQEVGLASAALQRATNPLQMDMFWVKPTQAHVTLLYTARVREDLFGVVKDKVAEVCSSTDVFAFRAKGLKLHEESRPNDESVVRGVWILLEPAESLRELRIRLQKALSEMDIDVDYLDFVPHIPLALTDNFKPTREFMTVVNDWADRDFGEISVRALLLKKTIPNPSNVEMPFTVIANVPVGKSGEF